MDVLLPPAVDRLPLHRGRLAAAARAAIDDPDVIAMLVGGSFASGEADTYSDLDLQLVVGDGAVDRLVPRLRAIAAEVGPVVAAFFAEHVGLPHMLIVLYEDLVHVDFEPVELSKVGARNVGLPAHVVWERGSGVASSLGAPREEDRARELAWLEDRIWTWSWYVQTKILRGERYEALSGIQYLRDNVLFELVAMHRNERDTAARRAESRIGPWEERFAATVASLDPTALMRSLRSTMDLYVELVSPLLEQAGVPEAESARAVVLPALQAGLAWSTPTRGSLDP